MDINLWLKNAASQKKAMPILSYPGINITGTNVKELVNNGSLQAQCMKAVADRFDMAASISLMDLSVEAEAFGCPVLINDHDVPSIIQSIVTDEKDIDNLKIPHVGACRTGEYIKAITEAKNQIKHIPVFAGSIGPFSLAGRLMDMTDLMINCLEETELVHSLLDKAAQFLIDYNIALKNAGADGIIMAEPAAGLLSPDLIQEFSTPYVKKIIEAVRSDDCIFIYHNCGNTVPLIESILKTGADAFHFGNAVDLTKILPQIPSNILVLGNIDPVGVLKNGTSESIHKSVTELLEKCSSYKNFILSSGCDIPPDVPFENIDSFFQALKDFK